MSNPEDYDIVVLGSGEAGKYLAWTLASQGKTGGGHREEVRRRLLPEHRLPAEQERHPLRQGRLLLPPERGVRPRQGRLEDRHGRACATASARWWRGWSRCTSASTGRAGRNSSWANGSLRRPEDDRGHASTREGRGSCAGENVVISTGSRARIDDTPGLRAARPLTHVEALELDRVPEHLIVLGGGYVGLELAQAMRRFGSRVTVVERNGSLIHREDPDVTAAIEELFRDEGIEVLDRNDASRASKGPPGSPCGCTRRGAGPTMVIEGTHLLVAAGRTPNTDGIGLEKAGVETDGRGHVKVDERLQTTAEGVWAVGDCAGSPYFTHIAFDDFRVVRDNLAGGNRVTTGRQVPFCLFTDPELARVGLSEREAKERGVGYRLAKIPMESRAADRGRSPRRGGS